MENKVEVVLDFVDEVNQLIFKLHNGEKKLNLESDNSDEIKKIFLAIIEELEQRKIQLEFKIGESFDESKNKLFLDASKEYIEKLNEEISELEEDEILKEIRKKKDV